MTKTLRLACLAPIALAACVFNPAELPTAPPPSGDAVALARAKLGGAVHLVLVTDDGGDELDGVDLGPLEGPVLGRVASRGIEGLLADAIDARAHGTDEAKKLCRASLCELMNAHLRTH
jgi:hypothetical protein